ncbi:MAG: putative minor capsid protein [Huintestinicola sp.]
MNLYPIPREILCHSCLLRKYEKSDIYGGGKLISETELRYVRIELHRKRSVDGNSERATLSGVLYYDCTNSLPEEVDLFGDSYYGTIAFSGSEMRIVSAKYVYGGGSIHHIEAELEGEI